MHVDAFIDDHRADPYARWMLHHFRMPASWRHAFAPFLGDRKLFCSYAPMGTPHGRWRVTGASRLGDVWLAADHARDIGYDLRVAVDDCANWGAEP